MPITLSELRYYPVKSLRGLTLSEAKLDRFGIQGDRRWMVVDEAGRFLTQRELPAMTQVAVALESGALTLRASALGVAPLRLAPSQEAAASLAVQVWNDRCEAWPVGTDADAWLSRALGVRCRLVYLPDQAERVVDQSYAQPQDRTAFSDGFPLLLISRASLDALNKRLDDHLPMSRFRPNLVVEGCAPFAEDGWRRIRIGDVTLRVVKPCSRCVITTLDPESGAKGVEPLRTLARFRRLGNKVYFGQNLLHDTPGELRLGMEVEVLEEGAPPEFGGD